MANLDAMLSEGIRAIAQVGLHFLTVWGFSSGIVW